MPLRRSLRRTLVPLGLVTATLVAGACSKSEPGATSTAATSGSSASSTPATQPPATAGTTTPPATSRQPGTTVTRGPKANTWTGTADGEAFSGTVRCARSDLGLTMDFTIEGLKADFQLVFASPDEVGTFEALDEDGKLNATGSATLSTTEFDTTVDGEEGTGISFSMRVATKTVSSGTTGTLEGEGVCEIHDGVETPGPTQGTGELSALPITDAAAFTQKLLDVAGESLDVDEDAFGAPDAWVANGLPKDAVSGSAITATENVISGFTTVEDKGGAYVAYAFAVAQVGGDCAYGFIYTTPDQTTPTSAVAGADAVAAFGQSCRGVDALEYFESEILVA